MLIHNAKQQELIIGTETEVGEAVVPDVLYGFQNCSITKKTNLVVLSENDGQRLEETNTDQGSINIAGSASGVGSIAFLNRLLTYILSAPTSSGTKDSFDAEEGEAKSASLEVTKGDYAARFSGLFVTNLNIKATGGDNSSAELSADFIGEKGTEVEKIKSVSGRTLSFHNEIVIADTDSVNLYNSAGELIEEGVEVSSITDDTTIVLSAKDPEAPAGPAISAGGFMTLSRRLIAENKKVKRKKPLNLARSIFYIGTRKTDIFRDFTFNIEANRTPIFGSGSYSSQASNEQGIKINGSFSMGVAGAKEFIANSGSATIIEDFKAEMKDGLGNTFTVKMDIVIEAMTEITLDQELITQLTYKAVDIKEISTDIVSAG